MDTKTAQIEPLAYFLSLSENMISETKEFLFDLMAETARAENLTSDYKEERIYLISEMHRLFSGIEKNVPRV